MLIDPLLSMKMVTRHFCSRDASSKKNNSYIACYTALETGIYSTLIVDITTISCPFVAYDIGPPLT